MAVTVEHCYIPRGSGEGGVNYNYSVSDNSSSREQGLVPDSAGQMTIAGCKLAWDTDGVEFQVEDATLADTGNRTYHFYSEFQDKLSPQRWYLLCSVDGGEPQTLVTNAQFPPKIGFYLGNGTLTFDHRGTPAAWRGSVIPRFRWTDISGGIETKTHTSSITCLLGAQTTLTLPTHSYKVTQIIS